MSQKFIAFAKALRKLCEEHGVSLCVDGGISVYDDDYYCYRRIPTLDDWTKKEADGESSS